VAFDLSSGLALTSYALVEDGCRLSAVGYQPVTGLDEDLAAAMPCSAELFVHSWHSLFIIFLLNLRVKKRPSQ